MTSRRSGGGLASRWLLVVRMDGRICPCAKGGLVRYSRGLFKVKEHADINRGLYVNIKLGVSSRENCTGCQSAY